jgi:hypothetical protein
LVVVKKEKGWQVQMVGAILKAVDDYWELTVAELKCQRPALYFLQKCSPGRPVHMLNDSIT